MFFPPINMGAPSAVQDRLQNKDFKLMLAGPDKVMLLGHGVKFEFARTRVALLDALYQACGVHAVNPIPRTRACALCGVLSARACGSDLLASAVVSHVSVRACACMCLTSPTALLLRGWLPAHGQGKYKEIIAHCSLTMWGMGDGDAIAPRVDPGTMEFDAVRKLFDQRGCVSRVAWTDPLHPPTPPAPSYWHVGPCMCGTWVAACVACGSPFGHPCEDS